MSRQLRFVRLISVVAACHFAIAFGSLAMSYTLVMSRFDAAEFIAPSPMERVATSASNVLFQPATFIVGALGSGHRSPLIQWVALACNSLLWGFGVALVVRRLARRSPPTRTGGPSAPLSGQVDSAR